MIHFVDAELYHIHVLKDKSNVSNKHSGKWAIGNNLIFGDTNSSSTNLLSDRAFNPYINIELEKNIITQLTKKRIMASTKNIINEVQTIYFQHGMLNKYFQFTREIIFEEVRQSLFPDKPSRLNGIWLTDQENIVTWLRLMPSKQFPQKLFLVKFSGNAHKADGRWITNLTLSFDKIYKNSIGYWSGEPISNRGKPHQEFICNGSLEIINEVIAD